MENKAFGFHFSLFGFWLISAINQINEHKKLEIVESYANQWVFLSLGLNIQKDKSVDCADLCHSKSPHLRTKLS